MTYLVQQAGVVLDTRRGCPPDLHGIDALGHARTPHALARTVRDRPPLGSMAVHAVVVFEERGHAGMRMACLTHMVPDDLVDQTRTAALASPASRLAWTVRRRRSVSDLPPVEDALKVGFFHVNHAAGRGCD